MPRLFKEGSFNFDVSGHGSIYLVRPMSNEAREWLEKNVAGLTIWFMGSLVVEPRFVDGLIRGIEQARGTSWT